MKSKKTLDAIRKEFSYGHKYYIQNHKLNYFANDCVLCNSEIDFKQNTNTKSISAVQVKLF